jgi:two-component system sensor histidine kinase BarA
LAVLGGILSSVSFFLLNEFRQTVVAEQLRLKSSAAAFASAAATSVMGNDQHGALMVLRGIRELPELRYAAALDRQGRIVAEIGQATMLEGRDGALEDMTSFSMLSAEVLTVHADVRHSGEIIGSIVLTTGIGTVKDRYLRALLTSLVFALLLMVVTAAVARALIGRIIRPLSALAAEFADIGKASDLGRRLTVDRDDEIGVLVRAFNDMFGQIERRDALLRRHRDSLEATVEERTTDLRVAKEDAERANAAKSDFLATMSHEIRTPMNGMMVMAEMLTAAPLAPKHLRYAEIISRSGRGLLNIINDILDFSKIEAGKLELEAIPFSIDSIVEDVISLFAERAREKGLAIALYISPELPSHVVGDPTRLTQVLGNLLNNALKFTEVGGVTVEVTGTTTAGASSPVSVEFHVRDTGIGIAPENIAQIFERFSQADQSITRKFGGTGLGLSISQKLVTAMLGQLSVASVAGSGSDFFFTIAFPTAGVSSESCRLEGKKVEIRCASELVRSAIAKAVLARGAVVLADGDIIPDVLLIEAGSCQNRHFADAPIVTMRPFATADRVEVASAAEIALPLRRTEMDSLAQALVTGDWGVFRANEIERQTATALPDLSYLKVLAVDDNAVNREVLSEALSGFGIRAETAASGEAALLKVQLRSFDVIFMDCSMPGMDGFTAAAAIRDIERQTTRTPAVIVALTAHVSGPEADRWSAAGMDRYVAKPFSIAQLTEVLDDRTRASIPAQRTGQAASDSDTNLPSREESNWQGEPLLDPDTLAMFDALSGTGKDMAEKVFTLFLANASEGVSSLKQAWIEGRDDVVQHAHSLKSMCLSAGARRAATLCESFEGRIKAGGTLGPGDLAKLAQLIVDTENAMVAYSDSGKNPQGAELATVNA